MSTTLLRTAMCAGIAALFHTAAHAREDNQIWTSASASVGLDDKWRLSQEFVARFSDHRNGLYEVEATTLLGYKLSKSVTIAGGYVHDPQYLAGDFQVMERRAREQITVDNFAEIGPGKLSGRMRMEQRWRERQSGTGWRLRPFLRYAVPLSKRGQTTLNLSTETFVNLNTTGFQRTQGVDRMRNLAAISTKLNKTIGVEAGYLNQYSFVRNGEDNVDHVAHLALSTSF